jgi:hypothetical protein
VEPDDCRKELGKEGKKCLHTWAAIIKMSNYSEVDVH